jgi:hypothetical protein
MSKGSRARPLSVSQAEFDKNWEEIFGGMGSCPCGRSPIKQCVGWHNLNEEQLARAKENWDKREKLRNDKSCS